MFENLKSVHILGISGTLMGAFAVYLKRRGVQVSGSDENVYPPMSDVLKKADIQIFTPYHEQNLETLKELPTVVIVGNVIRKDNPEVLAWKKKIGIKLTSLPEFLRDHLLCNTHNIVVAGTHGKTTTSSMLSFVLTRSGFHPSYFVGGVVPDLPQSFSVDPSAEKKDQGLFVLEGDEYDTVFWDKVPKFNYYLPQDVILTSIEYDHADIYPDFQSVKNAFHGLIKRIPQNGRLIACADYPSIREVTKNFSNIIWYGSEKSDAEYRISGLKTHQDLTFFDVFKNGQKITSLSMKLPGNHNALNVLSVWLEATFLGVATSEIQKWISEFQGVKRRQELRGQYHGICVIDDFAHHPTAVRETLLALKLKFPSAQVIVAFEPRSATSRRRVFQKEYAQAFKNADQIFISTPHDQSKIDIKDQFSSEELVLDLQKNGKKAELLSHTDAAAQVIRQAKPGDVVAILSNGGFQGLVDQVIARLVQKA